MFLLTKGTVSNWLGGGIVKFLDLTMTPGHQHLWYLIVYVIQCIYVLIECVPVLHVSLFQEYYVLAVNVFCVQEA